MKQQVIGLLVCLICVLAGAQSYAEPPPKDDTELEVKPEIIEPGGRMQMPMIHPEAEMIMRAPAELPVWDLEMINAAGQIKTDIPGEILVGHLVLNESGHPGRPSDYCLEDNKLWAGADYRINDLPVFDLALSKTVAEASGQYLISGEQKTSINDRLRELGPCPPKYGEPWSMMQWRDDWTAPEGSRMPNFPGGPAPTDPWSHARLKTLPYFSANHVTRSDFITIAYEKDMAVITVNNLFDKAIEMPLVLHYEGGHGKPQPRYKEVTLKVAPGGSQIVTADLSISDDPAAKKSPADRDFNLETVDLRGTLGRVTFDVSEPVRKP